jgi:hypothetical protein
MNPLTLTESLRQIAAGWVARGVYGVIVDVVFVNNVTWAGGWERGESQRVRQLLPDWGPGWMGVHYHEQDAGTPSK